jgi:hypothetical protein
VSAHRAVRWECSKVKEKKKGGGDRRISDDGLDSAARVSVMEEWHLRRSARHVDSRPMLFLGAPRGTEVHLPP